MKIYKKVTEMNPLEYINFLQIRQTDYDERYNALLKIYNTFLDTRFKTYKEYKLHLFNNCIDDLDLEIIEDFKKSQIDEILNSIKNKDSNDEIITKLYEYKSNILSVYLNDYKKITNYSQTILEYETHVLSEMYFMFSSIENEFLKINTDEYKNLFNNIIIYCSELCIVNELLFEYDKNKNYLDYKKYKEKFLTDNCIFDNLLDGFINLEIKEHLVIDK